MEKNSQMNAANLELLRASQASQIELVHRFTGARMQFDRLAYLRGELKNSGYNPDDWVETSDFKGLEKREAVPPTHIHPAFEGTGQSIGTHMGTTPAERAAVGDTSAERTLGHLQPADIDANKETAAQTIKEQQSQVEAGKETPPPPVLNDSDKAAAAAKKTP